MAISAVTDTIVVARADVELTIDVLANDRDVPSAGMIAGTSQAGHGTVSVLRAAGQRDRITYRPATGFTGADSFSYSITDGAGGTSSAVVSISMSVPSLEAGVNGDGRDRTYVLVDGHSVTPNAPFRPRARGNYSFTDVRSVDRQTTTTRAGVTQVTDVQTLEQTVVTSTETAAGGWTYAESVSSSHYATTAAGDEVGTFGDVFGSYSHTLTSAGSAASSSFTFAGSGESVGWGTMFDRWTNKDGSSGNNSQYFLTVDRHSIDVTSSANLATGAATGTLTGHGEGGMLIAGSGAYSYPIATGTISGQFDAEHRRFYSYDRDATTYRLAVTTLQDTAYSGAGTARVTLDGGSMTGTRRESGSTHRSVVAATVSTRDALGGWATTGTAGFHSGGSSSDGYDDSGTYTWRSGDATSGGATSGSLARDGGRTSSFAYDWTETLDASGSTRIVAGTGSGSLNGGDRWSQSGQGEFWLPDGGFRGTLDQSSSESTTYHYTTSAAIADGRWVATGTGGGTTKSQHDTSTDGRGSYASTTADSDSSWSVSGGLQKVTLESTSVDASWSETLGPTGEWTLASGTSLTTAITGSQTSNEGLGSYAYGSAGTAVSGTFSEVGDTSEATVITVSSSYADGAWGTTGSGASRRLSGGMRGSTGRGTFVGGTSDALAGVTSESAQDAWDDESFHVVGLVNGEWQLSRGGTSRTGAGTNTSSYDIGGDYASDASGVTLTGVRRNANSETTNYRYLIASQSTGGDWTTTGSSSTMVTGNGTRGYEGRGSYRSAGTDGGLAWTSGGDVGEAGVTSTIYARNWNEVLGSDGSWALTAGTGMSRDTGHDASSLQGSGTYASASPSASPLVSGTTSDSSRQGSDWTFTVSSAVRDGAWVDGGFGSGTGFDTSDSGYRGTASATSQGSGWTQVWNGKHSGASGSRTDTTWHQSLLPSGKLETTAATSTLNTYANDSSSYESGGTYSLVNAAMSIGGTTSESGSAGSSTSSTTRSELVDGVWVTTSGTGGSASWDGGAGSSIGSGDYAYEFGNGGVAGTIDEGGSWKWASRYDTASDLVNGRWVTGGYGSDESSTTASYSATGDGAFRMTLPGSAAAGDGTGQATDTLVIDATIRETASESFSRGESAAFMLGPAESAGGQLWQQIGGGVAVRGTSSATWDAWNEPPAAGGPAGSSATVRANQSAGLDYDLWSSFDGDSWTDGGTTTITTTASSLVDYRRQGTYAVQGLMGGLITGTLTETGTTDRGSSYKVVRALSSDGTWRVTAGEGSSRSSDTVAATYGEGAGTFTSSSGNQWDHATEKLTSAAPLVASAWFNTTSTIDPATGTWKTTGDGGSKSSGAVELSYAAERGYTRSTRDVDHALEVIVEGTFSKTGKATVSYDFRTRSRLAASGAVATDGDGTAAIESTARTWWEGGFDSTTPGSSTTPQITHTEDGDRNEQASLTTNWVFAGSGWQEASTKATTENASNGSFTSGYHHAWYAPGDPEQGDGVGSYAEGDSTTRASGSHDYTSSSELTRQAAGDGGFAVTGWRKGGGASHGTSHVHLDWTNTREWYRKHDLTADDTYDYTDDEWEVTFDADGMPTVTYAGTLVMTGGATWSVVENFALGNETTDSGLVPEQTVTQTRSAASDAAPGFMSRGGPSWTTSLWSGYGTSFAVDGAGYGYSESSAVPDAFGRGLAPDAATPPATPAGASTVPKGVTSEAANYEARLAGLSKPRLVTSGSRPLGAGSANLPAMPTLTTPAVGALGFEQSDSAPETPQTRAFASLVTSGMAPPVGAMADSGGFGLDYDRFSGWAHTGLSLAGAIPAFGIIPDAIDFVFTAVEIPFGKSTTADLGFATAGILGTAVLGADQAISAAKIAARAAGSADEALAAGKAAIAQRRLPRFNDSKPTYHVNPTHVVGPHFIRGKTPLPPDAHDVFRHAVPDDPVNATNWYGTNADGQIYRFSGANDGTAHFSGIDGVGDGIRNITRYARERLAESAK
jgi:hypothetical protein